MKRGVVVVFVLCLAAACGGSGEPDNEPSSKSISELNAELFSWKTPYEQTTCAQWRTEMTAQERATAAQQLLARLRTADRSGAGSGGAELVATFAQGIANACEPVPTLTLTDAAAGLYLTEASRFKP